VIIKRCSTCGVRLATGQSRCSLPGHDSFKWQAMVEVGTAGARKRHSAVFTTKLQAEAWAADRKRDLRQGTYVEVSKQTLGEYLALWAVAQRSRIRPNTLAGYAVAIRHITAHVGSVPLQAFSRVQAKALYQALSESGLAPKSVHNIHIALRKALGDAVEDGLIHRNPADRAHDAPRDRPEMLVWSAEELNAFLAFTAGDVDYPFFALAAATGMRRGELLGLRWRDVDLDAGRVAVTRQWTRQGAGKGSVGFGPPKSARSLRSVDLDAGTVAVLREMRAARRVLPLVATEALVFAREGGLPYEPSVLGRRFVQRVCDAGGLPLIGLHGLRHTHATLLLARGVDAKTVSERLGHASVETTLRLYAHVTPTMRAGAAAVFGALRG
jgi:integrase